MGCRSTGRGAGDGVGDAAWVRAGSESVNVSRTLARAMPSAMQWCSRAMSALLAGPVTRRNCQGGRVMSSGRLSTRLTSPGSDSASEPGTSTCCRW